MEQRLSMIALGVRDLQKSIAFYEDVIGWRAAPGPPGIAFFDLNGLVFSLYPIDELAKDMGDDPPHGDELVSQGFALAHNARGRDDVDAIFARLRSNGVNIVKDPEEAFWGGYSGYFSDPDGHRWEIAYNPFWPIDDDGRIDMAAGGTDGEGQQQ